MTAAASAGFFNRRLKSKELFKTLIMWHATGSLTCYAWTGQLEPGSEALSCTIRAGLVVDNPRWSLGVRKFDGWETSGVSMQLPRLGTSFSGQILVPLRCLALSFQIHSKLPKTARSACVCAMMPRIFALLCSSGLAAGLLVTTARLSRRRARHCAALLSGGFDRGCGAGTVESPRVARDSAWAAAVAEAWRADEDINASLTRGDTHRCEPATYLDEDGVAFHGELVWAEGSGFGQVWRRLAAACCSV